MAFSIAQNESQLEKFIDLLMHESIRTYKVKASAAPAELQQRAHQLDRIHKKGAVFAVRQKSDFGQGVRGFIITSKEALLKEANRITHFTPNAYRRYYYADKKRQFIKGFEEQHLQQVNTFVVDIDTKEYAPGDIILACIDAGLGEPTGILETDQGYQVYFVLAEPLFISNQKGFLSLKVAKRISENIKRSLLCVGADVYCNDFGFFRMPNERSIVWFNERTFTVKQLIDWSQRIDNDKNRQLYVVKGQSSSMLSSEWFQLLLQSKHIKGERGQIGRNNVMFTLALTCLQDGCDEDYAFDLLDQFNSNLDMPLSTKEVEACVASAYSGRYNGPKKEYVEQFIELYVPGAEGLQLSFGGRKWYKHKKARQDRERSHLHEWEEDICAFLAAEKSVSEPFLWCTQKELCEQVGIANSSLNKLMKQSTRLLKTSTKGRNAKTGWTTVELYIEYLICLKKDLQTRAYLVKQIADEQVAMLERVAGFFELQFYIKKLRITETLYEQGTLRGVG